MSANRALPARVAWIDKNNINPCLLCLVLDKGANLVESPPAHLGPLLLAKPCPVADAPEILQGQSAPGAFGFGNEHFGDNMVGILAKARFAPRNGFELAPNTPGAPAAPFPAGCRFLQTTAQIVVAQATICAPE